MLEENDDTTQYFYAKALLTLLFTDEFPMELERIKGFIPIDSIDTIHALKNMVETYQDVFDEQMKKNVLAFVQYLRFDYATRHPDEKEEIYNTANEIITILNNCSGKAIPQFVLSQTRHRHYGLSTTLGTIFVARDMFKCIKFANVVDFNILVTHSIIVDDEQFEEESDIFSDVDIDYTTNLRAILFECPELLDDELFIRRTKKVLDKLGEKMRETDPKEISHFGDVKRNYQYCIRHVSNI